MKAQIYHAMGQLDKAIENYKKVKDKSPDAARAIAFLEGEAISIPEVTVIPMAKPVELVLEYAGVAEAHVRAYKVDLTMLALRRKNLVDASSVEVAGIKPVFEKAYVLEHPNARRREKQTLTLDLKEPGAYLIGIKAGDFFASGLILRSNLTMSVQEESSGLRPRQHLRRRHRHFAEGRQRSPSSEPTKRRSPSTRPTCAASARLRA